LPPLAVKLRPSLLNLWSAVMFSALQIAIEMLESGRVDAVVCVQSDERDRFSPKPVRRCRSSPCTVAHLFVLSLISLLSAAGVSADAAGPHRAAAEAAAANACLPPGALPADSPQIGLDCILESLNF
jgi:hypothetical protein